MDFIFFDRLDRLRCDSNSSNMITPIFCQCHYLVQSEKMFKQNEQQHPMLIHDVIRLLNSRNNNQLVKKTYVGCCVWK